MSREGCPVAAAGCGSVSGSGRGRTGRPRGGPIGNVESVPAPCRPLSGVESSRKMMFVRSKTSRMLARNRRRDTVPARLRLGPTRHVVPFPGARASCPLEQSRAFGPLRARCPRSRDASRKTWLECRDDGVSRSLVIARTRAIPAPARHVHQSRCPEVVSTSTAPANPGLDPETLYMNSSSRGRRPSIDPASTVPELFRIKLPQC